MAEIGQNVATGRPGCEISPKGAVLPGRNDAKMGHADSLHALVYYSEYNTEFDLKIQVNQSKTNFCGIIITST